MSAESFKKGNDVIGFVFLKRSFCFLCGEEVREHRTKAEEAVAGAERRHHLGKILEAVLTGLLMDCICGERKKGITDES